MLRPKECVGGASGAGQIRIDMDTWWREERVRSEKREERVESGGNTKFEKYVRSSDSNY